MHSSALSRPNIGALALTGLAAGWWLGSRLRPSRAGKRFSNQVVMITGGSRGLGLELARCWIAEGAKVAICARNRHELDRAADELARVGEVLAIICDVTQQEQVEQAIEQVVARWGNVDVLVNNAGIIQAGPLACMTLEDYERTMATHFWGPLYLIRACLPHMKARGRGKVINIASIGGEISVPHLGPYCASKFALVGLSEGLASELRPVGIEVTTVCPGLMRTGSPRNAEFKGRHRAEYAWFSISGSLPWLSISSRSAAQRIVDACHRGDRYVRLSLPAKIAVPLRSMLPAVANCLLSGVNRRLPRAPGDDPRAEPGYKSFSRWSPSILTRLTEQAAQRNNEVSPDGDSI